MAGRRPGCGCSASLLDVLNRPWRIVELRRKDSRVQCLACLRVWSTRDDYLAVIERARTCVDKRRTYSGKGA